MKRVGMYIWDHLRGRHHVGRSLVNAIIAYNAVAAIHLGGMRLFREPFDLEAGIIPTRPPGTGEFVIQGFGIIGSRLTLIWGVVGVVWSAFRTLRGRNEGGPVAKLLSVGTLLLLVAALLAVVWTCGDL